MFKIGTKVQFKFYFPLANWEKEDYCGLLGLQPDGVFTVFDISPNGHLKLLENQTLWVDPSHFVIAEDYIPTMRDLYDQTMRGE